MGKPTTKSESLKTVRREINKQGFELDGFDRVVKIFTAPLTAVDGDYCHVRELVYYTTTNTVKGRTEGYGLWSSAYDF